MSHKKSKKSCVKNDAVNHPNHYTSGGIECIDAIKAAIGESFIDHCRASAIAYLWRYGKKGGKKCRRADLEKARNYIDFAIGDDL